MRRGRFVLVVDGVRGSEVHEWRVDALAAMPARGREVRIVELLAGGGERDHMRFERGADGDLYKVRHDVDGAAPRDPGHPEAA